MTADWLVPAEQLAEPPYLRLLTYPVDNPETAAARVQELKALGVTHLELGGRTLIGTLPILGKGCVSLVVGARGPWGASALKVRRVDANRPSLEVEAQLLRRVNEVGVGPRLFAASNNFLVMERVAGVPVRQFVRALRGRGMLARLRSTLAAILTQCHVLDRTGVDHGELSNLAKHVWIGERVTILDFESASVARRVRNVTSAAQYLFIGGPVAKRICRLLRIDRDSLLAALRSYKARPEPSMFATVLSAAHIELPNR